MNKIKIILVPIRHPKNWKGVYVVLPSGVFEFVSSDGSEHKLRTVSGNLVSSYSTLYQMVGYDPTASEENQFTLLTDDQWRLCSKFLGKEDGNYVIGLAKPKAKRPYKLKWYDATLTPTGYKIFRSVNL